MSPPDGERPPRATGADSSTHKDGSDTAREGYHKGRPAAAPAREALRRRAALIEAASPLARYTADRERVLGQRVTVGRDLDGAVEQIVEELGPHYAAQLAERLLHATRGRRR